MDFERVIFSGEMAEFSAVLGLGEALLYELYVYQDIHLYNGEALFLAEHLALISDNYKRMFALSPKLDDIQLQINALIVSNRIHMGSYALRLYLWRESSLLVCRRRLLYDGFTLWHSHPEGVVLKCENPFFGVSSSLLLSSTEFAKGYVGDNQVPIIENLDSVVTGVGDMPLFGVRGIEVFTTPLSYGAIPSVMRNKTIQAIEQSGYSLTEKVIKTEELEDFEEIFYPDIQGIVALGSYRNKKFYNLATRRIEQTLAHLGN